jgi:hypothetical protein
VNREVKMARKASEDERRQMFQVVELLLTEPRYKHHWWGYQCYVTEPEERRPFPQEDEGVWIQVTDEAKWYHLRKHNCKYAIILTHDLFGFEGRKWTPCEKALFDRWEAMAKKSLRDAARRGMRRANRALAAFLKEAQP